MSNSAAPLQTSSLDYDPKYERRAIILLSLGFGVVGLDRFIINPLFPVMAEDLNLSLQDQGLIAGVLALTWGLSGIFSGNLCDRIGIKKVLVGSVIIFSCLVAFSGLAAGLISLLIIRALMGFAEGGYVPASIVATVDASRSDRIGMNIGIQQMSMPFFGLFIGPLLAIGLLGILPGWEYVFGVIAIPGFILAYLLFKNIKSTETRSQPLPGQGADQVPSLWAPLQYRNIVVAIGAMFCFLTTLHVLATFLPIFITDYLDQSMQTMGGMMAALGGGGLIGMILIPSLSDRFGRKIIMVGALTIECFVFLLWVGSGTTSPALITPCLFLISLLNSGVVATIIGPIVNTTVPRAMAATATGLVGGLGEIVGGAIAPAVSGTVADAYGVEIIPKIILVTAILGTLIIAFGIEEPKAVAGAEPAH
ncbi:MAG: MFS transporter [Pseudomonadota bacterium]